MLVNSYVIYVHNMVIKPKNYFATENLKKIYVMNWPWGQTSNFELHKNLKDKYVEIIGEGASANEPEHEEPTARKICGFCPSKKKTEDDEI